MGWLTITEVASFRYRTIISITIITTTAIIIATATIIIIQCIKAIITEITTQIIAISIFNIITELVVADIVIIDIIVINITVTATITTTSHCFKGLLDFTLRGYQDTASTQGNSRNLLLPLTNDEWWYQQNSWCLFQ
jgi:hypothetical protein